MQDDLSADRLQAKVGIDDAEALHCIGDKLSNRLPAFGRLLQLSMYPAGSEGLHFQTRMGRRKEKGEKRTRRISKCRYAGTVQTLATGTTGVPALVLASQLASVHATKGQCWQPRKLMGCTSTPIVGIRATSAWEVSVSVGRCKAPPIMGWGARTTCRRQLESAMI